MSKRLITLFVMLIITFSNIEANSLLDEKFYTSIILNGFIGTLSEGINLYNPAAFEENFKSYKASIYLTNYSLGRYDNGFLIKIKGKKLLGQISFFTRGIESFDVYDINENIIGQSYEVAYLFVPSIGFMKRKFYKNYTLIFGMGLKLLKIYIKVPKETSVEGAFNNNLFNGITTGLLIYNNRQEFSIGLNNIFSEIKWNISLVENTQDNSLNSEEYEEEQRLICSIAYSYKFKYIKISDGVDFNITDTTITNNIGLKFLINNYFNIYAGTDLKGKYSTGIKIILPNKKDNNSIEINLVIFKDFASYTNYSASLVFYK